MDEMKLRLTTKFMRKIVAKLLTKLIYNKTGYKINIQLNDLDISVIDCETKIAANVELNADSKEFMKFIKDVGLED
jgi:phage gp45-like